MCDYRLPALLKKLGFGCFPHKTGIVGSEKLHLIVFMWPDGANKARNCSRCQVNCFKPACWRKQKLQWSSVLPKHFLRSLSVEAPHFSPSPDLKSNAKVTRRGVKPCSACSAVGTAVLLPEYTGITLQEFCWCGNKIFALCKIRFQVVFVFNCFETASSTCVRMGWTTQHLWLCTSWHGKKNPTPSKQWCPRGVLENAGSCLFCADSTLAPLLTMSHKSKGKKRKEDVSSVSLCDVIIVMSSL